MWGVGYEMWDVGSRGRTAHIPYPLSQIKQHATLNTGHGTPTAEGSPYPPVYSTRGHRSGRQRILELRDLVIGYGDVVVVRRLSMHIHEGEFVALVGPNGAGKTTTLRTIQGLIRPRQGEVWLMGERIDHLRPHERVARGLVSIPEGRRLFPEMTVRENLDLGAYTRRARTAFRESLEMVYSLFPVLKSGSARWPAR